ncbi:hypothetical protein PVA17_02360 [Lysinibacillus sp. CNPSo 3705]|uniref:hypothetical protein n=1 Tax=Lysinibacillus sp. CNPSo 3705 TaxID=3028148 RepID=UPI00236331B0|nr:hypothetical protein [Lysinibacillus sp. CNPSo 3705]MDD1501617.1 hypothetical protein [Lysinibacillus sp. CNPSo 3705]
MDVFSSILEIPSDTGYWLVRADGGKYYDDFFLNNFIAVSDNEITLEMISKYNKGSLVGITTEFFKDIYSKVYSDWTSQQVAHAVSRTQKFIVEMKIGDLILVPSRNSKDFLIGVITSDVYQITEEEVTSKVEVNFAINPFLKRRNVKWIKEISRREISDKLYWILSAHQTIFNLEENKDNINQLLAPIYVQDGICHGTIKISKKEGLNVNEWYDFYSIIKEHSDEMIIKSNVQSPGLIEFVTENAGTIIAVTTVLSGFIIGEVNIMGIKLKGILPYFQSHKKGELEMEVMVEEKRAKQLENERTQFELEKEREIWETKKLETQAERLRLQLQISNFDAGRVFGDQMQTDNQDDQDAGES